MCQVIPFITKKARHQWILQQLQAQEYYYYNYWDEWEVEQLLFHQRCMNYLIKEYNKLEKKYGLMVSLSTDLSKPQNNYLNEIYRRKIESWNIFKEIEE